MSMESETSRMQKPDLERASVLINAETRERFYLTGERVSIGRDADNTLRLDQDIFVSGHHAQIYQEKGEVWLRDLGSRNGTSVNNLDVSNPVKIRPGDTVMIGKTRFVVE